MNSFIIDDYEVKKDDEESVELTDEEKILSHWKFPEEFSLDLEDETEDTEELELFRFFPDGGASGMRELTFSIKELKRRYPDVKLHALGPPEVDYIARRSSLTVEQTLERLRLAGLDSLPGAGAEILDNEIRKRISPGKCSADRWCEVMHIAHTMGFATSATMMYGHIETIDQRLVHLEKVRTLQSQVPDGMLGFLAFIPWIFRSTGTRLETEDGVTTRFSSVEYLRLIAISRLMLNNIPNIQASWLTVGAQTAQLSLWGGANDMGSIMIEENVVSSAGAHNQFDANGMKAAIRQAGFTPRLRDQKYNLREEI
jgi:cyclic dehypoxanthinyl futalosine synthase